MAKAIYSLTEKAIQLLPMLAVMAAWGIQHMPVSRALAVRAKLLEEGGPALWAEFMEELRATHLGAKSTTTGLAERLQTAYEAELAKA